MELQCLRKELKPLIHIVNRVGTARYKWVRMRAMREDNYAFLYHNSPPDDSPLCLSKEAITISDFFEMTIFGRGYIV